MPGGTLRTEGGEILLRTKGQAYLGTEFEDLVVLTREDGTRVYLRDVAEVRDGFAEGDLLALFDGQPAAIVKVLRIGKEDIMEMAEKVRDYVADARLWMPDGIELTVWADASRDLQERVGTLLRTAGSGLVLVLAVLALFLKFRLAMWVAVGIPIAMLGTIALFPFFDVSISTMTVMSFILVLGILVDDAIVVGERVYAHEQLGKPPIQAAVEGTWEVARARHLRRADDRRRVPAAAHGRRAHVPRSSASSGVVVIMALGMSIVESQWIPPGPPRAPASATSRAA